jgi:hypothetical protein
VRLPRLDSAFTSRARSFIAARSSAVKPSAFLLVAALLPVDSVVALRADFFAVSPARFFVVLRVDSFVGFVGVIEFPRGESGRKSRRNSSAGPIRPRP